MSKNTKKKFKNTKVGGFINRTIKNIGGALKNQAANALGGLGVNTLKNETPLAPRTQTQINNSSTRDLKGNKIVYGNPNAGNSQSSSNALAPGQFSGAITQVGNTFVPSSSIKDKTNTGGSSSNRNSDLLENGSDALNNPITFEAQPSYQPSSTITNRDITSTTPNLPNSNVIGGNADFYNQYLEPVVPMSEQKQLEDQQQTDFDKMLADMVAPQDKEKTYKDLEQELQIQDKKQKADEVANRINTINAQAEANQLSLIGQGRGIPEAIIGGQSAQIAREAAIRVLPLSAEYAAAKGDFEYAQDRLDKLYQIKVSDIDARTAYDNKIIEYTYNFADKKTQAKLEAIKERNKLAREDQKELVKFQMDFMGDALKNGQTSLASKFKLLDVNSKTFRQDLLNLRSQLREPAKAGSGSGIGTNNYVVKTGDTGRNIAASLGLTWDTLNALNPGVNWDSLRPGQKLNIDTGDLKAPKDDSLTDVQLRQEIRQVISTDEFKQLTKSQKEDYILSQGGDPLDYEY